MGIFSFISHLVKIIFDIFPQSLRFFFCFKTIYCQFYISNRFYTKIIAVTIILIVTAIEIFWKENIHICWSIQCGFKFQDGDEAQSKKKLISKTFNNFIVQFTIELFLVHSVSVEFRFPWFFTKLKNQLNQNQRISTGQ